MVYRRTHQVVKRLAARRSAILSAARDAAAEAGMAAVQIAPVAVRANVAAGTVYRYFPSKADLISELIADVSRDELAAIRRAADAAPGPSSALAAAVSTVAVHVLSQRKLAWGILAEPVDVDVTASRLASRRDTVDASTPSACAAAPSVGSRHSERNSFTSSQSSFSAAILRCISATIACNLGRSHAYMHGIIIG